MFMASLSYSESFPLFPALGGKPWFCFLILFNRMYRVLRIATAKNMFRRLEQRNINIMYQLVDCLLCQTFCFYLVYILNNSFNVRHIDAFYIFPSFCIVPFFLSSFDHSYNPGSYVIRCHWLQLCS